MRDRLQWGPLLASPAGAARCGDANLKSNLTKHWGGRSAPFRKFPVWMACGEQFANRAPLTEQIAGLAKASGSIPGNRALRNFHALSG